MKVTRKTRLLAAVPIAQSQDGTVKVFSVKDNGQSESFNLAHEWTMKGSGFQRGGTSSGLYVDNVSVFAGEHATNFNSMAITDKTVKLADAQVELIPAGSYPNARLEIALGLPAVAIITQSSQSADYSGGDTNGVSQANPVTTIVPIKAH